MAGRRLRRLAIVAGMGLGAVGLRRLARYRPAVRELVERRAEQPPALPLALPPPLPLEIAAPEPAPVRRRRRIGGRAAASLGLVAALVAAGSYAALRRVQRSEADTPVVAPPVPGAGPTAQWAKDENARAGTSAWRLAPGRSRGMAGFADAVSAQRGDAVSLYVSTAAAAFHVEAYRMGYYGGRGGRLVWRSPEVPGRRQDRLVVEPTTGMAEAEWSPSLTVRITDEFVPGAYLFKLVGQDGGQQYVPLAVRDDASTAAFVVEHGVSAWQADDGRVVSFDRPYALGRGSGRFLDDELAFVAFVESLGLDVTYWTDVDRQSRPGLLARHKVLLSLGGGAEAGGLHGVKLVRFGAGPVGPVALASSPLGPNRRRAGAARIVDTCPADMTVLDTSSWVFSGTPLKVGDRLPGLARVSSRGPGRVVARSSVACGGRAEMAVGAAVFDAGMSAATAVGPDAARITANVLKAFGA
ncbi:MAG TPA: N,N-dimethylformamidase beta subunit family domain-containing protein [Acidimicrobiales bacterium]|nr:N,N-dimethylformamidase beta subunit family domain-containing protein [Acidimicrobiales bacterium]